MDCKSTKATICAILGNIIWGFGFLFTSVCLSVATEPNVMLAHRFILSTICMLFLMLIGKGRVSLKGKNWKPIIFLLLMQLFYYLFETYSVLYTNSTMSGLVLSVVPVVTIGTGALFLKEYPTRRQLLFCTMPVAGVIIMTVSGKDLGVATPLGIFFLLLTMLASALYKTANRKASAEFTPFERTFFVLLISATVFSFVGLGAVDWNVTAFVAPLMQWKYLLSVLSLGILSSIVANILVNYATEQMSAFKISAFGSLSTLCAGFAGIVILKEPVSVSFVLGGILILIGVQQVTKPGAAKSNKKQMKYVSENIFKQEDSI